MTPTLTVIAGPNGSGKTTVTKQLHLKRGKNFYNADEIATDRAAENGTTFEAEAAWAANHVRESIDRCIAQGETFSYETVLSHDSHVERMRRAVDAGFQVRLVYTTTSDPQINVARVADRVAKGGHDVPAEKIRDRYRRSMDFLLDACRVAHRSLIFDNSAPTPHIAGLGMNGLLIVDATFLALVEQRTGGRRPKDFGFLAGPDSAGWKSFATARDQLPTTPKQVLAWKDQMMQVPF